MPPANRLVLEAVMKSYILALRLIDLFPGMVRQSIRTTTKSPRTAPGIDCKSIAFLYEKMVLFLWLVNLWKINYSGPVRMTERNLRSLKNNSLFAPIVANVCQLVGGTRFDVCHSRPRGQMKASSRRRRRRVQLSTNAITASQSQS